MDNMCFIEFPFDEMPPLLVNPDEVMFYALQLYGVWCYGKRARCYEAEPDACVGCEFYNGRGCNK